MRKQSKSAIVISWFCLGLLAATPLTARAQDANGADRWKFNAAIYLWAAGLEGKTRSGHEIDLDFSDDVLDNLNFAFMGAVEARKRKWSFLADVIYMDLSGDKAGSLSRPIGNTGLTLDVGVNADVDLTGWVLNFKAARNVFESERGTVNVLAGARYLDLESKLTLRLDALGTTTTRSASPSGNVWDGIIGAKGVVNFTPRWYLPYYIDVGTGQSDITWQGAAGLGYRYKWGDVTLLYRKLHWDFKSDRQLEDLSISGPMLGAIFRF